VLEVAAGTGVVTRAMASALPGKVSIVATDLNPAMLDKASSKGTGGNLSQGPAVAAGEELAQDDRRPALGEDLAGVGDRAELAEAAFHSSAFLACQIPQA
jgi:hypothetical protein